MKHSLEFLKKAVSLTQVLTMIAAPIFLCIIGGLWLVRRFSLSSRCMAVFILLGVSGSLWSLWKWIRPFLKPDKKEEPPTAFNDHF